MASDLDHRLRSELRLLAEPRTETATEDEDRDVFGRRCRHRASGVTPASSRHGSRQAYVTRGGNAGVFRALARQTRIIVELASSRRSAQRWIMIRSSRSYSARRSGEL